MEVREERVGIVLRHCLVVVERACRRRVVWWKSLGALHPGAHGTLKARDTQQRGRAKSGAALATANRNRVRWPWQSRGAKLVGERWRNERARFKFRTAVT